MDLGINDRAAIVTASSRGMGRAIAGALAAEGCRLAICSRNSDEIAAVAQEIHAEHGVEVFQSAVDVSDTTAVAEFVENSRKKLGPISIVVANAGGPPAGRFEDFEKEDWLSAFRLNFFSTWALIQACLEDMKRQEWGRVVTLTSTSVKQPIDGLILSNSVRASVLGMLKTLAAEYGPHNILFNNVGPGLINTDRLRSIAGRRAKAAGINREQMIEQLASQCALKRVGQPQEFADVVAFLCSERVSYVTGSSLMIDGGLVKTV